jgi:cysteine synthase/rhodanese-related sulfurtransferase
MSADHALRVYDSILGLLPSEQNPTPLVRINRILPFQHTQVFAKLEWFNPFGAVKDRVAANMIRDAESRDVLGDGKKLVEATSGNTGLGLAMVGNARGYALRTPLSSQIPLEKRTVLRFIGADVMELTDLLCPAPGAPEGAIATARDTAATQPEYVLLDQYANEANPDSHYRTTGPEIWRQTGGRVTHFVAGLGTCGTITGTGRYLKEQQSEIQVIGVYPEEGHDIPGVRSAVQLQQTKLYRPEEYNQTVEVGNREAYEMCLRLNREESIIGGPSSGMALSGAFKTVADEPGNLVVVVFPDDVFKYATSFQRHFPDICPADPQQGASGPTKNDLLISDMLENLKNPYDSIRAKKLQEAIDQSDPPLIVDVRSGEMFAEVRIPGSVNIPQDDLAGRSGELPEDRDALIIMVCGIGKFSKQTTLFLKSMGYRNVRSMKGGVNEWVRKGLPTESSALEAS